MTFRIQGAGNEHQLSGSIDNYIPTTIANNHPKTSLLRSSTKRTISVYFHQYWRRRNPIQLTNNRKTSWSR
ncbi:hypothetical protein COLO4_09249 [Corchorus olitorius]|uniref:Uncharacterized protein n=1 Tax=Corchorus olitorius TaxID=93759 RepID=A0A1R3KCP1_9ROSI|nr:hypothetical protein COLO4_09249 [Corchorus olitorius]